MRPTPSSDIPEHEAHRERCASDHATPPVGLGVSRPDRCRRADYPGVGFKSLQTYMGHASITVTLNRYGRLLPGTGAKDAALLDQLSRHRTRGLHAVGVMPG